MTHTGFEPMLTAWEAAVLTTWPMGHLVRSQGLEPGTHWLRVSCSTNWAKSGNMGFANWKLIIYNWKLFLNFQFSIFNFSFGYAPSKLNIKSSYSAFSELSATLSLRFGQAFGLLVSVSSIHYCTSTSDLSTSSSTTSLSGDLILGRVSRLDAFSVYLVRT